MSETEKNLMERVTSLAKRRGFIFAGSDIYGGLANSWDFGPLGAELKKNIKDRFWKKFVLERADVYGLDAAIIMNTDTWKASGHLATFADPLVEDKKTHKRYRLDHLLEAAGVEGAGGLSLDQMIKKAIELNLKSPDGNELTDPAEFNLMLKTQLGATEEKGDEVYLRPETAQGIFVNFKNVVDTARARVPFGIAQIGKSFRNELTPGNYVFRTREFEQMEIEFFVREDEWETWFEHWREQMNDWISDLGIADRTHEVEVTGDDLAHYSKRTIDFEYEFPFGQKELYGLAYRTDHDLMAHQKASGKSMEYMNPDDTKDRFVPHVIEPSLGVERTILAAMLSAYSEEEVGDESRVVLKFPYWLAPVKAAVLPLMKKDGLAEKAQELFDNIKTEFVCDIDVSGSIGRRYRRQDEVGTPFCVTVDHQTLEDETVTVRDRDSLEQERVSIANLTEYIHSRIDT